MGKIADISKWQGTVDWVKAKTELDLVILRVQDGASYADPRFHEYATACEKHGIPYGVYGFFRAKTVAGAKTEALKMIERVDAHRPLFWVADVEVRTTATNAGMRAVVAEWLATLGARKTGLYISTALYPFVTVGGADFVWIPRYGKNDGTANAYYKPKYPCDLWQYTSVGRVAGISGNVDLNVLNGSKPLTWFTAKGGSGVVSYPASVVHRGIVLARTSLPLWQYSTFGGKVRGTVAATKEVRILAAGPNWYYIRRGPAGIFGMEGYVPKASVRWIS